MLLMFPTLGPWIIVISGVAWTAKQFSDISLSIPRRGGGSSLRRLRLAKETADLAEPETPEHDLLVRQQRRAAIDHAAMGYAPPDVVGWVILCVLTFASVVQASTLAQPPLLLAFLATAALVAGTQIVTERDAWRKRNLIRQYCEDNPQGRNLEKLLDAIKSEERSKAPEWLLRWADGRKTKVRKRLKDISHPMDEAKA
jgi:hypothetical protein